MTRSESSVQFLLSIFLIAGTSLVILASTANEPVEVAKQRGVAWVAGRSVTETDFVVLAERHVDWITQTPFGWQDRYDSPTFQIARDGRILWGERDRGIEITTRLAKKYGIKTLLKPHIWLRNRDGGKWRSDIEMAGEADWQSWFATYREFILHYARLAQENGIEALSVGTELHKTVLAKPGQWRQIIARVRQVYSGKLTYSANWYREFEDVSFWDQLDFIGVQAYFPLTDTEHPTVDELMAGWQPHLKTIERIQSKFNKPILFTEIGYRSSADGAIRPWEWSSENYSQTQGLQTQANCYEAFFRTFWHYSWFAGAHFWKWFPGQRLAAGRRVDLFTPQNKPAEAVLTHWYGKDAQ